MHIDRRKFIKLTSITSLGAASGFSNFLNLFENIPANEQLFIPISAIYADPRSILDEGIHLRWSLPPSKGIPDFISIYRRKSMGKNNTILVNPANSESVNLPRQFNELSFSGSTSSFSLTTKSNKACYAIKPVDASKKIRITFTENVDFCTLHLGEVGRSKIEVFYPDSTFSHSLIAQNNSISHSVPITSNQGRPFKFIEIELNFKFLYAIEFSGNQYLCDSKNWEQIGKIDHKADIINCNLFNRITSTTKNYYLKTEKDKEKYSLTAKQYCGMLRALQELDENLFAKNEDYDNIRSIPFDELEFKSKNDTKNTLNAHNLLMLGSLDPNIARFLGMYYVDTSINQSGGVYDYKIEVHYDNNYFKKSICGVILYVGEKYTEQTKLKEQLISTQINDTRWEFDNDYNATQLGQVRLLWKNDNENPSNESWKKYLEPVVYSLKSDNKKSRLISPKTENGENVFIDRNASVMIALNYAIKGIDLFGQESNEISSNIKLKDKDIPAAPVNLNFHQKDKKTYLHLEYGGFQYLTDPNIDELEVFMKTHSIYNQNVKTAYQSFSIVGNNQNGFKIFSLSLSSNLNQEINYHSVHFLETIDGKKLPAIKRKKFRVIKQSAYSIHFLVTSREKFIPDAKGKVLLETDPREMNRSWNNLNNSKKVIAPLHTRLLNYVHFIESSNDNSHYGYRINSSNNNLFAANIVNTKHIRLNDEQNLFDIDNTLPLNDSITEIIIDRTLNESDIFSGGFLETATRSYEIISQNAGYNQVNSNSNKTKIFIAGHHTISGEVFLKPAKLGGNSNNYIHQYFILWLENQSNLIYKHTGEFLFRASKSNTIGGETFDEHPHVIAKLLSDVTSKNGMLQVLVRISKKLSNLSTHNSDEISNKLLYFEPYVFDISNQIEEQTIAQNEAFTNAYFTSRVLDKEKNSSPLSVIAQFIKTRSKENKPDKPSKPFPCDNEEATEAYLKLPNSEGISFFKLCWKGSSDYRYEVGRASDKSIIASHRDLWYKGLSYTTDSEQALTSIVLTNIGRLNSINGTVEVTTPSKSNIDYNIYLGGRFFQGAGASKKYFEIVKVKVENNSVKFLLRPMIKGNVPSNSSCTIQKLPDYNSILENDAILTQLANLTPPLEPNPDNPYFPDSLGAFSVVTIQPLRNELSFLDEVPGFGNSRFFYKVRAVDGSENRSLWSGASVPVWQVDTRVPEAPIINYIEGQEQAAYIKWKNEGDEKITGYNLYRTNKKFPKNSIPDYSTERLIKTFVKSNQQNQETVTTLARIRVRYNQIELPDNPEILNSSNRITGIFRLDNNGLADQTINYFIGNPTSLTGQNITNIPPEIFNEVPVVVVLNTTTQTEKLIINNDTGNIRTSNGQIQLPPFQNIDITNPIKGIFKTELYEFGKSVEEQKTTNHAIGLTTRFIASKRKLVGLYEGIKESEAVAIQITKPDGSSLFINEDPSEFEFKDDLIDFLTLDLFYNYRLETIKTIKAVTELGKITSVKSKDALVQIKMNTPPPMPEIVSVEWWDVTNNRMPDSLTLVFGIKLKGILASNNGTYAIRVLNLNTNLSRVITIVDAESIQPTNNKYFFEDIIPYSDKNVGCEVSLIFKNFWNQSSLITANLNSLTL